MKTYKLFFIVFVLNLTVYAQEKLIKNADKSFEKLSYIDAQKIYQKVIEKGYANEDVLKNLADSYYFNGEYADAAIWYGKLKSMTKDLESDYLYRYALSLRSIKSYNASDAVMEELYNKNNSDLRVVAFNQNRDYIEDIENNSLGSYKIEPILFNFWGSLHFWGSLQCNY